MNSARCPICHDIISPGVSIKLFQTLICPTCLGRLQAVSINPFELEPVERQMSTGARSVNQSRGGKKSSFRGRGGPDDIDDDADFLDDYVIEHRLRYKSDHDRHRRNPNQ